MILKVINHQYVYDMKNLCTVFFPYEKIHTEDKEDEPIVIVTEKQGSLLSVLAKVYDVSLKKEHKLEEGEEEQTEMSVLLFDVLSSILGFTPPWGILYGVRPAKLMHRLTEEMGDENAARKFTQDFLASKAKTDLTVNVMHHENKIIALSDDKSFSLYVSIPFCPTRCSYCSFVSHSIERTKKLMKPYVDLLIKELEETAKYAHALGLKLRSVYFGGGTPTTLEAEDLTRLFKTIEKNFDFSNLIEYTVEAGRPDTVTKEKLLALKNADVSRISINPQTFNDKVLETIGRRHTADRTIEAFELARSLGFDNINMDFIAGLPEDTLSSFKNSINKAVELQAESVTVHTLALKSAAYLVTREETFDMKDRLTVSSMVDYADSTLASTGYYPYYMYRQSKSLGNLENVGWCKEGMDCLYNVFMMDETHTVLSVGAGAVIKLKAPVSGHLERIYNYKYPYEYINDFNEILNRKKRILTFFNEYE